MVLEVTVNATELEEEKQYINAIDIWIFCVLFCFVMVLYAFYLLQKVLVNHLLDIFKY